jgi:hypothetical protein
MLVELLYVMVIFFVFLGDYFWSLGESLRVFDGPELTAGGDRFFVLGMLLLRSMPEELPPLGFVRFKALIFDASLVSSDLRDSVNTSLFSIKIEVLFCFFNKLIRLYF